jgi:hypothetical protein
MDEETRREIEYLRQQVRDLREDLYNVREEAFERYLRAKDFTGEVSVRVAYIEGFTGLEVPDSSLSLRKTMGAAPMPRKKPR